MYKWRKDTDLGYVSLVPGSLRRMTDKINTPGWIGETHLVQGSNMYNGYDWPWQRGERWRFRVHTGLQLGGSGRRESWPQTWLLCTLCNMLYTDMLYAICYTQMWSLWFPTRGRDPAQARLPTATHLIFALFNSPSTYSQTGKSQICGNL